MRAVRLHAFGPAENLTYEKTEDPVPGPGEVRIAVAAAGVHLLDTALREGQRGPLPELPALPTVPGREVAGVVDALGDGVDGAWLGKRVVAHLGFAPGGYAELVVTGADRLHEVPEGLGFAEAVAMIGTGRTALGIVGFAEPGPDDVVVVPAAAGGIGTLLVQYAKNAGATVVGLAGGARKTALVRAEGADVAVDYTAPGWPAEVRAHLRGRPATIVYDGVGGDVAREAVALLGPGGRHLVFGWSAEGTGTDRQDHHAKGTGTNQPGHFTEGTGTNQPGHHAKGTGTDQPGHFTEGVSESVLGPAMLRKAGGLRALELRALAEAAEGRLRPAVTRFPLAEAASAHRALQTRGTTGKVVLEP